MTPDQTSRPAGRPATAGTAAVRAARNFLIAHATDYDGAVAGFRWPELTEFNFALEWFDVVAAEHPDRPAVTIVDGDLNALSTSYGALATRSDQVASWLTDLGVRRGDAMIVMLNNTIELWQVLLGLIKIGAVAIPTSTLLSNADLAYRVERADARFTIAPTELADRFTGLPDGVTRLGVGEPVDGWVDFADASQADISFEPDGPTRATDTCLLYFTSGTTARPKLVRHTQVSYSIGHLSTMWWLGVRESDVHLNISSPGWGKHAWSNFFAPFLAEATVFIFNYARFDSTALMRVMDTHHVTSFCAPPTVWRMLIQADLTQLHAPPRELVGAGEPLNPEVIAQVRAVWGSTIRDGFGQTETTCWVGNSPGQPVKDGSMGRPMPGYTAVLIDPATGQPDAREGEICLDLARRPLALMAGYWGDDAYTAEAMRDGYYHSGDIAARDADGYLTYVGRADDVFKASDYKISPFELESVLLEHAAVAEAAVVPSPHPVRLAVPKAYILLAAGHEPGATVARSIFAHARAHLSGYQLIRIIEFTDELPKTISGKIRRVDLRSAEAARVAGDTPGSGEQFLWRDHK